MLLMPQSHLSGTILFAVRAAKRTDLTMIGVTIGYA
jgi:hypothetical protein